MNALPSLEVVGPLALTAPDLAPWSWLGLKGWGNVETSRVRGWKMTMALNRRYDRNLHSFRVPFSHRQIVSFRRLYPKKGRPLDIGVLR